MDMEIWKHEDTEKHGKMEIWKHGEMEKWRHGDMVTWRYGDIDMDTWTWRH